MDRYLDLVTHNFWTKVISVLIAYLKVKSIT